MISSEIAALPRPVSAASGATRSRKIGIKVEDVPVMGCVVSFRAASRPARNRGALRWVCVRARACVWGGGASALWLRVRAPRCGPCGPPAAGTASETGRPGYVGGCPGMTLSSTVETRGRHGRTSGSRGLLRPADQFPKPACGTARGYRLVCLECCARHSRIEQPKRFLKTYLSR